jgi:hypothetical protein
MPFALRRVGFVLFAGLFIGMLAPGCHATAGSACYRGTVGKSSVATMTLQKQPDASFLRGYSPFIRALNSRLRKDAEQSFKELEKRYRDMSLERDKTLSKGEEPGLPFSGDVTVEVMYCDGDMISILYTHNSWTGWFHSIQLYSARTYYWDGNGLRELAAGDMIATNGWAAVTKLCVEDLGRRGAFWASDAQFDAQHPPVMNAAPSGLVVTFAPYEVGPYMQGTWTVVLPYVAVKPYLQSKTPVEKLASQWKGRS